MIVVLLLGAAAALWGATELSWGAGTGGPGFAALAVLAVASLAGVYALAGWPRRLLGAVVVVAGGYVCWRALGADGAFDVLTGRGLALLGGVLFVAGGALVARHADTLPTMGAKYERAGAEHRSGDPDKDMWDGLSGGQDPTADGPRT
jgi:tryptophan-associated transmembrane protein